MREKTLDNKVARLVKKRGGFALKIHGSMFQAKAVDFVVCYRGRFIAIEDKVPGNNATAQQLHTLETVRKAGGKALVCYDVKQVEEMLDGIDKEIEDREGRPRSQAQEKARKDRTLR